jgi:hypothetical protein
MKNKRCSVDQRINGQRTYQRTTEVVPSSGFQQLWKNQLHISETADSDILGLQIK